MKGFAFIVLCVIATAQARSTAVARSSTALAELGENPWVVHLRLAVSTSGLLNSCAGSLIDSRWVLTAANCVRDARFIWIRYGVVTVINPELVTETSAVTFNPDNLIALVSINREVQTTANIAPVSLADENTAIPESTTFCGFGATELGGAGEQLRCYEVSLTVAGNRLIAQSEDAQTTRFDIGAPLVSDGAQIGVLVSEGNGDNAGSFASDPSYADWIQTVIGRSN